MEAKIRELISIPAIDKIKAATLFPEKKDAFDAIATVNEMIGDHPLREECYEEKKVCADLGTCYDVTPGFVRPRRRLRYENRKCVTLRAYLAHPRTS